jgi:hypothetical protein
MHRVQLPAGPVDPAAQSATAQVNGLVPTFSYPVLHVQLVTALLPAGDVLNTGHSVHAELAGRSEYVPAPQF